MSDDDQLYMEKNIKEAIKKGKFKNIVCPKCKKSSSYKYKDLDINLYELKIKCPKCKNVFDRTNDFLWGKKDGNNNNYGYKNRKVH